MKKLKKIKLSLIIFTVLLVSSSCEKDLYEDAVYKPEKSIIKYGIQENQLKSEPVFNDVKNQFTSIVNSNNSKSNNTSFFDLEQDLINRLDLEKTHLNSIGNKQVLNAPIKTFGSYKRALLALKNNQHTSTYIITYPNPQNDAVFYVANLQGKLLQKVTIQPNGIGLVEYFNDSNNNTSNKENQNTTYNSGCSETVYVTCSSGDHSFDLGNAHECYYWNDLSQGTPPRMFSIACDDSGGSGGNDNYDPNDNPFDTGNGNPNDNPYDGSDNNSFGGGFSTVPSQNGSNPDGISNCITNIDCPDCNLQNDINNDCNLDANEIMFNAFYNNSLNNMQQLFLDINVITKNKIFNYLRNQNWNSESLVFAQELIDSSIESGLNLDIEKSIKSPTNVDVTSIDTTSVEGQKFNCVYKKLMESPSFKNLFENTFGGTQTKLNVKFEIAETLSHPNADGTCKLEQYVINGNGPYNNTIKIKKHILGQTNGIGHSSNIRIANVIIHELMHAYLNIKMINCNQGATLPTINNLELGELIQLFYDNFNCHIDVNGSPQSQHDFMYSFLIPSFQAIFNETRDLLISQAHIDYANGLTFLDTSLNIIESWDWNNFFKYISLNGLHQCESFTQTTSSNPVENFFYQSYSNMENQVTKTCN